MSPVPASLTAAWRQFGIALIGSGLLLAAPLAAQQPATPPATPPPATPPAQAAGGQPPQTKVVPAIRTTVYDRLAEAQVCIDEGDTECALEILDDVSKIRDLNTYETAQVWNFRAFLNVELDNVEGAIEAYETIVGLPREELPDGLIQTSIRNLATLYLGQDRLEEGLDMYLQWMDLPTVTPGSNDYYVLATIYYQMDRYTDGLPAIDQAIQLARNQGQIGEENWYLLKYVLHYQLEQIDEVIETLTFMVNNWTKRNHVIALAGQQQTQGRDNATLTLFEAAYEVGWLTQGTQLVQLASMYMNASAPYKAAKILQEGLDNETIESTPQNWRMLAQAWQLAAEHEKALPALEEASRLADDGEIDRQLAQSLASLARWEDCASAARRSLERGVDREDFVNMQLGQCLLYLRQYDESRRAFEAAARDDRAAADARRFLRYIETEVERARVNAEALASLEANRN